MTVLMSFSALACENVSYETSSKLQGDETSVNIYEQLESEMPNISLGENEEIQMQTFTIVTNDTSVYQDSETQPGTINNVIADRNDFLRAKYGAEIKVLKIADEELTNELKNSISAGTQFCDMLSLPANQTVKLYIAGLLEDMNSLPDFNVENAYFDSKTAKSLATNSTLYLLPDPTSLYYDDIYAMFFNRDLVVSSGAENPETLVAQGKWTWDKFNETVRTAASDVYNTSTPDLNTSTFGFGAYYTEDNYPMVMWTSCGQKIVENSYKRSIEFSMSVDSIVTVAEKLMKSYNSRARLPIDGNGAAAAFESGRLVFFVNKLDYLYALRDGSVSGSEYGVLPMPKYTEEQHDYCCLVDSDARVISVPKTLKNADESKRRYVSLIISATCASGRTTIKKAYLQYHIAQYLMNNNEAVMLETVIDSATFDFTVVYGESISAVRRATTTAICDYLDFGSGLANSINRAIASFNEYSKTNFT